MEPKAPGWLVRLDAGQTGGGEEGEAVSLDSNAPGFLSVGQELAKFLFGTVQKDFLGLLDAKKFKFGSDFCTCQFQKD